MNKTKLAKHFYGAYHNGYCAFQVWPNTDDVPALCPYQDHRTSDGKVTFSRAFRNLWIEGFEDARDGLPGRYSTKDEADPGGPMPDTPATRYGGYR